MPEGVSLGFDTSAAHCAAALLSGDDILTQRIEPMAKGQAERLFPIIEELLVESGITWSDLSVIGVGTGPGNFTGIRIAVAAARGLSLSLGIPAIGISVPEAMALDLPRPCRIVIPARANHLIWQNFRDDAEVTAPQQSDTLPPGPAPSDPVVPLPVAIARLALARRDRPHPRPAPIYLRPADAAPARDRGPVMLP
ncbi:tRNA (adenosine(37)-N6)-threonylcarbamoyltransferase complex dimerization subunit type 1 TsaB (plasmid) [Paracoccus sp. TK19116]|uniref:tRNA (Adenosine(37)-N6)-threonylcarbamoyltransferase complex dimerization subunit type 1 TsaB n=1 Tax=Paracoccus albicereus TaxID=2922394 RepID=A0ABT1ML68_9RHOB|nr:tRNA (adenosine(37)-N6)-threonylcarbamoyltransferase complex dimerization subunit type 1 TsaB [Paracoccus albicereus]MCQ0969045.1 tRNA (adenosine(37)-N6)-threonylcarbamoyltransferase complex dimerization subunit type 1 TsaB [Paracoccus albicereus]